MASILTKQQFVEILQDKDVTKPEDIAVFQTIFSFEEHKAYASQVGRILGSKSKTPGSSINLQMIHRERDVLPIDELKKYYKNAQEKINTNP